MTGDTNIFFSRHPVLLIYHIWPHISDIYWFWYFKISSGLKVSLLETPITTPTIFILVFLLSDPFLCQRSEKLNVCIQRSKLKKCIIEVNRSSILYYAVTMYSLSSNRNSCFYMFWVSFILFFCGLILLIHSCYSRSL